MKKIVMFLVCVFVFLACEKTEFSNESGQSESIQSSFKGAIFDDWEAFYAHHVSLENLEDEYAVLNEIKGSKYIPFLEIAIRTDNEAEIEVADQLTYGLMAILNNELQFKVADSIISFRDSKFYISDDRLSSFSPIKNIEVVTIVLDSVGKYASQESKIFVGGDNTAGYSHRDFWRNAYYRCSDNTKILGPSNRQMRYTQQLKSLRAGSTQFLFIETKLYWRNSSNKLQYAETEERNYVYSIIGTIGIASGPYNTYYESPINFQHTVNCTKSQWNRQQLANVFPVNPGNLWNIDLTGTITHHINGDLTSNKWFAPVNWR